MVSLHSTGGTYRQRIVSVKNNESDLEYVNFTLRLCVQQLNFVLTMQTLLTRINFFY